MAGRPPSHDPKRANQRVGITVLPSSGREGPAPEWPLPPMGGDLAEVVGPHERENWERLWMSPEAVAWESLGWTQVVARYARVLTIAEMTAESKLLAEARQLEDRLGLTPKAKRMLLWVVSDDEVGAKRQEKPASSAAAAGRRLVAVDPAG